jgi:hypothetical protein
VQQIFFGIFVSGFENHAVFDPEWPQEFSVLFKKK